jgi:hypothetical protein
MVMSDGIQRFPTFGIDLIPSFPTFDFQDDSKGQGLTK